MTRRGFIGRMLALAVAPVPDLSRPLPVAVIRNDAFRRLLATTKDVFSAEIWFTTLPIMRLAPLERK